MAAGKAQSLHNTATQAVAITSKNEMDTWDHILEKVRKAGKTREEGFKIDKIRKANDRRTIMGCDPREEINRIKDRLKQSDYGFECG